jgi:hypothetical protein
VNVIISRVWVFGCDMLIILPLLAFLLVFLDLLSLQSRRQPSTSLRAIFLETAAFIGGALMMLSEGLSLFKLLGQAGTALGWGLAILVAGGFGIQRGLLADAWQILRRKRPKLEKIDLLFGAALVLILGLLLVIALLSPPNNNDSLQYHMSRVMHWAQDHSLNFYPTAYEPQLDNPFWAETAILNARLLWGDDKLANLVQWGSLIAILIGVSAIAKLLGAGRKGQWAAVAFAVSIPMAILQATSTQNDLVTAFWLIGLLYFVALSAQRDLLMEELLALAFTFGLGLATKGTFYPYAALPMIYFIVQQFRRNKPLQVVRHGLLIAVIVLALNLGFWGRNLVTFGSPLGSVGWVQAKIGSDLTPGGLAGRLVRTIFLNLVTPKDSLNTRIIRGLQSVFRSIDPQMANFKLIWGWNHEDLAGNPLHLFLVPVTLIGLFTARKRLSSRFVAPYSILTIGAFILLAIFINFGVYDGRYELGFFIAWAPAFGIFMDTLQGKWITVSGAVVLLIASLPWVFFNRTRPLIAMRPSSDPFTIPCLADCTAGSVLNEPPTRILFAGWIYLQGPYTQATRAVQQSGCKSVGLQIDSHDLEYTFWWLLDAPQSGVRIEVLDTYPELQRYVDQTFKPCAVLCTICKGESHVHGLPLVNDYTGDVQLYMGSSYSADPNQ